MLKIQNESANKRMGQLTSEKERLIVQTEKLNQRVRETGERQSLLGMRNADIQ